MAYDAAAKQLVIKVIGTVESDLNYSAINYGDPITVGICQWYGVRAANILCRMRDENPGAWRGVVPSIEGNLWSISKDDPYWNQRRLTQAEGESLRPVIGNNRAIQDNQTLVDMDVYKGVAENIGMDPENNTKSMLYFFTMYHQGPVYAFQVIDAVGPDADLLTMHQAALANPVLGQYGSRYRVAYDLISVGNVDGVGPLPANPDDGKPVIPMEGQLRFAELAGNLLYVTFKDGHSLQLVPDGRKRWVATADAKVVTPAPPPPPGPGPAPVQGSWTHPLPGAVLTSPYGPRGDAINGGMHYGADLSTGTGSVGQPVLAPTTIKITVVHRQGEGNDFHLGTAGNYVKGHSVDGKYSFNFFHLSSIACAVGQTINVGGTIGVEGATGNVTGLHLHLEAYAGQHDNPATPPYGSPIDPLPILRANGVSI